MKTLVTLITYNNTETAYFLKTKFEEENIDCFFSFVSSVNSSIEEIQVQVEARNVEQAVKILLNLKEDLGKDIEDLKPKMPAQKILVPTGFSKVSEHAAYFAIHLAERTSAEIKLLHVYENPVTNIKIKETATYMEYVDTAVKEAESNAKKEILAFSQKMQDYIETNKISGVKIHSCITKGNTAIKIKSVSEKYNPDVIILGTRGKTDDPNSILSGLANDIVVGLKTPLFAIHGEVSPTFFKKIKILYTTDFNDRDHNSLEQLLKITERLNKKITCIHIDSGQNNAKEDRISELNWQLSQDYSDYDIQCRLIEDKDVIHGIKEFAERAECNLLSFTVRKKSIFDKLFKPNLFKKILQEANMPILIFPS